MIKKGMHERALAILDEVVKLDPSNFKAHIRKARCFIDLTQYDKATETLKRAESITQIASEKNEVLGLFKEIAKSQVRTKKFAERSMKSGNLYEEKKEVDIKDLEKMRQEAEIRHLEKMNNIEWLIYPYVKLI